LLVGIARPDIKREVIQQQKRKIQSCYLQSKPPAVIYNPNHMLLFTIQTVVWLLNEATPAKQRRKSRKSFLTTTLFLTSLPKTDLEIVQYH